MRFEEAELKGDRAPLPAALASGCKAHGGALVFAPTIDRVALLQGTLGASAADIEVLPLHGRLTPAQQQREATFCDSGSGKRLQALRDPLWAGAARAL